MSKLIIDITELATWRGKLTGVPRVMNELASRFAQDPKAEFVMWNDHRQALQKVSFSADQRAAADTEASAIQSTSQKFAGLVSTANKIKARSAVVRQAIALPERAARKLLKPKPVMDTSELITPRAGDTLFILADWHGADIAFVEHLKTFQQAGVKLVQVSYDMLPIVTPQYSGHSTNSFTNYVKTVYPICDLVFSISQNTKHDIIDYLKANKLNQPPVEVIRLGDDFAFEEAQPPAEAPSKPFLLCVGTVEARKNHTLLYYAYKLAALRGVDLPKLVIVGRPGWLSEDARQIISRDPVTKDRLLFMQNIADGELSWLYENCLFTIYPSFYEGWGLPVAESVARGVPCLSSNTSSLPEIAGDLVGYFSPASADECLAAIEQLLQPEKLKQAKEKLKQYQPTSWEQTYDQVKAIIGKVDEPKD